MRKKQYKDERINTMNHPRICEEMITSRVIKQTCKVNALVIKCVQKRDRNDESFRKNFVTIRNKRQ